MALLQVRNFPDDKYAAICAMAKEERRTIAQQTILLIENGLECKGVNSERRQRAIERTIARKTPDFIKDVDYAALIREDRER